MKANEIASIICKDLNTYEEEIGIFEPIQNGYQALHYLQQQWLSNNIQVLEASKDRIHLFINNQEVILSNQNLFREWHVEC